MQILERDLTRLVEFYHRRRGQYPARIEDLVSAELLKRVPQSPLPGHRLVYDQKEKRIRSEPPVEFKVHESLYKKKFQKTRPKTDGGDK